MNNSFEDRRKYLRIYRNFILSYSEKGKSADSYEVSQVNNVSKGGVSFSSAHSLMQGTIIEIELKAPFISDSMRLEGVVLEAKEKIPELIYEIRVQFQNVPEQALTALGKIEIYSKSQEDKI